MRTVAARRSQPFPIPRADLVGVGVLLMPDSDGDISVGAPPVPGSVSDRSGIKSGDKVLEVNGKATKGRTAFDIIEELGKEENDVVQFTVKSGGGEVRKVSPSLCNIGKKAISTATILNTNTPPSIPPTSQIPLQRTFTKVADPVSFTTKNSKKDGKIGYIRISEFNSKLSPSLASALSKLEAEGVSKYVIDLRGNGGGSFQSAVEVAGFFTGPDKLGE